MKTARRLEVKLRQIIWAIKQLFKPTTYDLVFYKGQKYFIKSSMTGENIWNLFELGKVTPRYYRISGHELKIVHSIGRFISVFRDYMFFQKSYWRLIDEQKPIGTRLSYINSDNIRFNP